MTSLGFQPLGKKKEGGRDAIRRQDAALGWWAEKKRSTGLVRRGSKGKRVKNTFHALIGRGVGEGGTKTLWGGE